MKSMTDMIRVGDLGNNMVLINIYCDAIGGPGSEAVHVALSLPSTCQIKEAEAVSRALLAARDRAISLEAEFRRIHNIPETVKTFGAR